MRQRDDESASGSTRDRLLDTAMELFGRQGFHRTTVAQIEDAAGLSVGAGGMYRHVAGKAELLRAGLQRQVETATSLGSLLDTSSATDGPGAPAGREVLVTLGRAALRRLAAERDLNRLLLRDLVDFPELLELVRETEIRRVHAALTGWLTRSGLRGGLDAPAVAAVVMSAVSHYWVLTDVFGGTHPMGVDEDRFLGAVADLVLPVLSAGEPGGR